MELKHFLQKEFRTKDLGNMKYFNGMEIGLPSQGMQLSRRKYVLDVVDETGLLGHNLQTYGS